MWLGDKKLRQVRRNKERTLIIHLSCQTLGDQNDGMSPRITSIAVMHASTKSVHSFSIHLTAEVRGICREDIESHYDELECEMLRDFYIFVGENSGSYWIHWNMRDIDFGFEAIAHRYKVLSSDSAPSIPYEKRISLPALISHIYGRNYAPNPKMAALMEMNGGAHRDVMSGKDEVVAFNNKEFFRMHKSTKAKVYFFQRALSKLLEGKLRTKKNAYEYRVNRFMERPTVKVLSFAAVMFAITQFGAYVYELATSADEPSTYTISE